MRKNRRRAALSLLALAMALAAARPARADGTRDTLLAWYYGGKTGLSVLAAGTALTDPYASTPERVVVGGSALLVGVPSAMILANARHRNPAALRRWRTTAFVVDAALSALALGAGVSIWADRDSSISDQYAGLGLVALGLVGVLASSADLVPFAAERR